MDKSVFSRLQTQRQTLRHVEAEEHSKLKARQAASDVVDEDNMDEEALVKRWESFFDSGCTNWYDQVQDVTFSSTFCRLTRKEADIIVQHYRGDVSCDDAVASLGQLKSRLAKILEAETAKSSVGLAFIKLNTRSPKDSPKALKKAKDAYNKRLQEEFGDEIPPPNDRWKILSEEATKVLAIDTTEDALELLLDSERVFEDIELALDTPKSILAEEKQAAKVDNRDDGKDDGAMIQANDLKRSWPVCLVARAWDPRLKPASEFRGICWDGKLACLNQYFHSFYFSEIVQHKEEIEKDILDFVCRPDLKSAIEQLGGHCILDFCWLGPGNVQVVELNPFDGKHYGTLRGSTGLFVWDDAKDHAIMQGKAPFEFRVRKEPEQTHKLKHQTHPAWRDIVFPPKFKTVKTGGD